MNKKNRLIKKFFIAAAPIFATSILGVSPTRAATFASSSSQFKFENFSQNPSTVATSTDTNAFTIVFGENGIAGAEAKANAAFLESSESASNSNLSKVSGENQDYFAFAQSQSEIIGNFDIEAGTSFSFDFMGDLNLETRVDNPSTEGALSIAEIFFVLWDIDNKTVLDGFSLIGKLISKDESDFIKLDKSNKVNASEQFYTNFGGLKESIEAPIKGSYKRFFTNDTNLRLVEVKLNTAVAKAPEPSGGLALLLPSSLTGVILKLKRK
jgi:hypothetical protein